MKSANIPAIPLAVMLRVGKIVATHGLSGDIVMTHITGKKSWLKAGDVVFVALQKDSYIPHFVKRIKATNDKEITLQFEEMETVEAARKLVSREVYVKEEMLLGAASDSPLLWIGFEAIDAQKGSLGLIKDMYKTAQQWLATVEVNGKEALLPIVDQTLGKVDLKKKQVFLNLPDGLLEIYS